MVDWIARAREVIDGAQSTDKAIAEPWGHQTKRAATVQESAELRRLIESTTPDWPLDERDEAHVIACADPVDALTSWRAFSAQYVRARELGWLK